MIESEDKYLIVDTGPDFRTQMLKEKIEKLNYALVTHTHLDHIACLYEMMLGGKMELYIPKEVLKEMKDDFFLRWLLLYIKKRNPEIKIKEFKPFRMGRVKVDSIKLIHQKDFGIKKYPCYGYLFEKNGIRFAYLSDFNEILEPEKVENLDLMICDGAVMEPMLGHVGIKGGIELYKKFKPKKMLFTHISHQLPPHKELESYVNKFGNIGIAYDGMKIK